MPITHAHVNPKPDGADTDQTQASDWNAAHVEVVDLATAILALDVPASGYWRGNDVANPVLDSSGNGYDGTADAGVAFGIASPVNDGETALRLDGGVIAVPDYDPGWWAEQFSIGFSVEMGEADVVAMIVASDGLKGPKLLISSDSVVLTIYADDGSPWIEVASPPPGLGLLAAGSRLFVLAVVGGQNADLYVNRQWVARIDFLDDGVGVRQPDPGSGTAGLTIEGGEDSPVIAHAFMCGYELTANERESLFTAAGFPPIGTHPSTLGGFNIIDVPHPNNWPVFYGSVWHYVIPTVRSGTGVPSGLPTGAELPFAFDDTAVTGGMYFWNGSAWVRFTTNP